MARRGTQKKGHENRVVGGESRLLGLDARTRFRVRP